MQTLKDVIHFLANDFIYIIEDDDSVHENIRKLYPYFKVKSFGELTIITSKDEKNINCH